MAYIEIEDHLYRYESDELPTGESSNVTFVLDGETIDTLSDVEYNSMIEKPTDPIVEGLVLESWYKDQDFNTRFYFDKDRIVADTTLYARMVTPHTMTFKNVTNVSSSEWVQHTRGIGFGKSTDTLKTLSANGFKLWFYLLHWVGKGYYDFSPANLCKVLNIKSKNTIYAAKQELIDEQYMVQVSTNKFIFFPCGHADLIYQKTIE